ncbi:MAG: hypothetical protein AAF226_00645 [Verrucomicrobiota bacterium]
MMIKTTPDAFVASHREAVLHQLFHLDQLNWEVRVPGFTLFTVGSFGLWETQTRFNQGQRERWLFDAETGIKLNANAIHDVRLTNAQDSEVTAVFELISGASLRVSKTIETQTEWDLCKPLLDTFSHRLSFEPHPWLDDGVTIRGEQTHRNLGTTLKDLTYLDLQVSTADFSIARSIRSKWVDQDGNTTRLLCSRGQSVAYLTPLSLRAPFHIEYVSRTRAQIRIGNQNQNALSYEPR